MVQKRSLSIEEQRKLLVEFCQALLSLKNIDEVVKFLTDLLTKKEVIALSKRIKIGKLLIEGKGYREIEGLLKVSHVTIAKVASWLAEAGEGFRLVTERTKKEKPKPPGSWDYAMEDWRKSRRRYPLMFWPQLLIEDIIKSANQRQKKRIYQALEKLDKKSKLYKQLNKMLTRSL